MDFIPLEDRKSYEALFLQNSKNSRIDASVVQAYLAQSGLPNHILASIWNLAIRNGTSISYPEFALAMFLAKSVLNGAQLPETLPVYIVNQLDAAIKSNSAVQGSLSNLAPLVVNSNSPMNAFGNSNDIKIIPTMDSNRDWAVLPEEKARYDQIFKASDSGNLGYISGDNAKLIFSQSGLRENMLAHIWNMADMQNRGKLNSDEFAVAMHLIYRKLNGHDLPQKLPNNLIPPSQKALSSLSNLAKLDAMQHQPQKRISPSSSLLSISNQERHIVSVAETQGTDIESEEKEREAILEQVEVKRREVAAAKEAFDSVKKQLLVVEKHLLEATQQSLNAAKELKSLIPHKLIDESGPLSPLEIANFNKLLIDIPSYISDCRKFYDERAKNQIQKINAEHASNDDTISKDKVVNKAAALLAERMAALGVKSTLSTPGAEKSIASPSSLQKYNKKDLLVQVEKENSSALALINELETRYKHLSAKIQKYMSKKQTSQLENISDPTSILKYENGVGFFSREALDLVQKLKLIRNSTHLNDALSKESKSAIKPALETKSNLLSKPAETSVNHSQLNPLMKKDANENIASSILQTPPAFASSSAANGLEYTPLVTNMIFPSNSIHVANSEILKSDPTKLSLSIPSHSDEKALPFSDSKAASILNYGNVQPENEKEERLGAQSVIQLMKEKERLSIDAKKREESEKWQNVSPQKKVSIKTPESLHPDRFTETENASVLDSISKPCSPKSESNLFIPKEILNKISEPTVQSNPISAFKYSLPETPDIHEIEKKKSTSLDFTPISHDSNISSQNSMKNIPPPLPPPTNSDGSVVAIKLKNHESNSSNAVKSKKPILSNQGPNLFALVQESKSSITSAKFDVAKGKEKISEKNSNIADTKLDHSKNMSVDQLKDDGYESHPLKNNIEISEEYDAFIYEVTVLFDYEASEENDLPALVGDILKVEREDGEWIFCRNKARSKGWIPKSFVTTIEGQSLDELRASDEIAQNPLGSAEVMYDFEARNSDEISCLSGQVVIVLDKSGIDWWLVEHSGRNGLVPANFLEERTSILKGINDVEALKDASLEKNPFCSAAILFSPSASEFPIVEGGEDINESNEEASRKKAVAEIIKTERSFVEDLTVTKNQFFLPMSKMRVNMRLLFSNFLQIFDVNTSILNDFEVSLMNGESIGAVFLKHLDDLQCYKVYCENLSAASTYLQKLRSSNPTLNSFLKSQQNLPVCKHLDLSSYLLIPMQRITRYALLLRQILHYTAESHREYDSTMIALQMSEELLDQINTAIKMRQSVLNIARIINMVDLELPNEHDRLDLKAPTRLLGDRIFLHEGVLFKAKSGRKLTAYLFNDFLLLVHLKGSGSKPYSLYRQPLMLDSLTVKDTPNTDSFQIFFEEQVIILRSLNVSEKRQWINQIESAKKSMKTLIAGKNGKVSRISSSSKKIGTLSVLLCEARDCMDTVKTREIFAFGQIRNQILKSKIVPVSFQHASFKQSLIFSLPSLDEMLQISIYRFSKYSEDVYLGQAEIQLDILEYYAGKQTDIIELPLKDGGFKSLTIQLTLKK